MNAENIIKETQEESSKVFNSSNSALSAQNTEYPPEYKNIPPIAFKRNEFGLLNHINYKFTKDGFIDWKAMVPREYLYINPDPRIKTPLEKRLNKPFETITIDEVEDRELVILLGGLKLLAQLRGFNSVKYRPVAAKNDYSTTVCTISWIPNYETEGRTIDYEALATASPDNTTSFGRIYLNEIAENRAFCRAVRSFLKINIVSKEELGKNGTESETPVSKASSPDKIIKAFLVEKSLSFDQLKSKLTRMGFNDANNYTKVEDIPPAVVFTIMDKMKGYKGKKGEDL